MSTQSQRESEVLKKEVKALQKEVARKENLLKELEEYRERETERASFWESSSTKYKEAEAYYREELVKAHTLLGRVTQQLSERSDRVNLTKYFPTSNPYGKRTRENPYGE
jgi:chromosome segregation ATPase